VIRSVLIGLAGGQRAMTPLAAVAAAARLGRLPPDNPAADLMARPLAAAGAVALAAAEMAGDKMKTAPDRTVPSGLAGRAVTSAFAGWVVAPAGRRPQAAGLAAATALASGFGGLALRKRAMARWGQTATGFAEDAAVLGLALWAAGAIRGPRPGA